MKEPSFIQEAKDIEKFVEQAHATKERGNPETPALARSQKTSEENLGVRKEWEE